MNELQSVEERIALYTKMDEHLQEEIKKAEHELHIYLKAQHEVRRKLFNAQFEQRNPGK